MGSGTNSRGADRPPADRRQIGRAACLGGLALLAVASLRNSLAIALRPYNAEFAHAIAPENAAAASAVAERLVRNPSPDNVARAADLAEAALARDPTMAEAARTLAITRDLQHDPKGALALLTYAERLSRRDLPTELWFIEDAVRRNDIPAALKHYDIALRTTEASKPLLFPVLSNALSQPEIVPALVAVMARRPAWAGTYLDVAVSQATDLKGLSKLLIGLAKARFPIDQVALATATTRMVSAGLLDEAWETYLAARDRAEASAVLRDPQFETLPVPPSPFDWSLGNTDGVSTERGFYRGRSGLLVTANTGRQGVAASQLVRLFPGRYRIALRAQPRDAQSLSVQLRCARGPGNAQVVRLTISGADQLLGTFGVEGSCSAYWVELLTAGEDGLEPKSVVVESISIAPYSSPAMKAPR